jgi:hypothetical protein
MNNENTNKNKIGTCKLNILKPNSLSLDNKLITKYTKTIPEQRIKFIGFDLPKMLVIILGFYIFVV